MTIEWGPIREHDGSAECPAEARDVPCTIRLRGGWHGEGGGVHGWVWPWEYVTAYCLPADVPAPAPAADPVRDALVEACQTALDWFGGSETTVHDLCKQLKSALALAKGERE